MTKLEQAARQALEALEELNYSSGTVVAARMYESATAALREALAVSEQRTEEQAEQDLDACPGCGGVADNGHDREFPPNPYYCTKCTEQAEQEPVASSATMMSYEFGKALGAKYAAPVRTKDLTDDEIDDVVGKLWGTDGMFTCHDFARAVIAADREKNK